MKKIFLYCGVVFGVLFGVNKLWRTINPPTIILASTTSTEDTGLLRVLTAQFKAKTGIDVKVIAVGTGQAFAIATRKDADALLVHDRKGEDEFVQKGFGYERKDVMTNNFILLAPKEEVCDYASIFAALKDVAEKAKPFASRGDDSGTHRRERSLWAQALLKPQGLVWYKELGSGMGQTLNTASAMKAFTLADRGTWASFSNKTALKICVEGDNALLNPYGAILVNENGRKWQEWLVSSEGKAAINAFRVNGRQLFYAK